MTGVVLMVMALDMDTGSNCPSSNPAYRNDSNSARAAYLLSVAQGNAVFGEGAQGRSEGGPGVPVTPLCKPFLRKQPTIFRGENAMTIM